MDLYQVYFNMQVGSGFSGVEMFGGAQRINGEDGRIYIGSSYQRGHGGIGSFLAGIFRRVLLLFTRGAKAFGKEAVRACMIIMFDVTTRNTPFKESIRQRFKESNEVLKRKTEEKLDKLMEWSGFKSPHYGLPLQLRMGVGSDINHKGKKKKSSSRKRKTRKYKSNSSKKGKAKRKQTKQKKKRYFWIDKMTFLYTHSCECLKSELFLFEIPPTQTTIEN